MFTIRPIHALTDNFIWCIIHTPTQQCAVVDPGDAAPVISALEKQGLELASILITHHHWDHTNGIDNLLQYRKVPVYGPNNDIALIDHRLQENDSVSFHSLSLRALEIPGHTLDHIAYIGDGLLFCGDTLFLAGCGRVFEGTFAQMHESLNRLAALPKETAIYCGHEYTLANLQFARSVEPDNIDIHARIDSVTELYEHNTPSVPGTLAMELRTNPFLRTHKPEIVAAASSHAGQPLSNPIDIFAEIRQWKDQS